MLCAPTTLVLLLATIGQQPTPVNVAAPVSAPASAAFAAQANALASRLKQPGLTVGQKNKLRKQLAYAQSQARDARAGEDFRALQAQQQAYVQKMMPIWLEQQRQNAQFSIESAKASALQQMANTAELRRRDALYLQYQQNQILGAEVRALQNAR